MPKTTKEINEKDKKKDEVKNSKTKANNIKKTTKKNDLVKDSEVITAKEKTASNKTTTKKNTSSTKTSVKKTKATKKTTKTSTKKEVKKLTSVTAEYYDLPYRYNQTVVKILAQTPTTLFVYWDISDDDRMMLQNKYGNDFFNNTKPVLLIHNTTMNYTFEIDINDFANSWYFHINDADCNYVVELGRRPISNNIYIENNYVSISYSNNIQTPNDHILIEKLTSPITFKNVKTNKMSYKDFGSLSLIGIKNIYTLYNKLYKDEIIEEFNKHILKNPSSSSFFK